MIRRDIPARLKRTPIFPPAGGPVWNQKVKGVAAHSVAAALMNHFTPGPSFSFLPSRPARDSLTFSVFFFRKSSEN